MTDFVYPSYFEAFHKPGSVQFDRLKKVNKPFQILAGGYQIIFKNGKWTQIFGSEAKKKRFQREDRRGHRSEERAKRVLERADPGAIARADRSPSAFCRDRPRRGGRPAPASATALRRRSRREARPAAPRRARRTAACPAGPRPGCDVCRNAR